MPADRSPRRQSPGRGPARARRDPRAGSGAAPRRTGGGPRRTGSDTGRDGDRGTDSTRGGPKGSGRKPARRVPPRQVERPTTAAERRAAEVKARRGVRPPRAEQVAPPPWEREEWIDEGPVRQAARQAADRARQTPAPARARRSRTSALPPDAVEAVEQVAPAARAARYHERLAAASDALDRGRYGDARRMVAPVLRDLPDVALAHEIAGLALYREGTWRAAAKQLELARQLDGSLRHHAVLADCYRALRRYHEVEELWRELREGSPGPELVAEGRIVAAGALADRGDLAGAVRTMERAAEVPRRVRDHHLRQWYVLADLYDRSGEVIKARRWFGLVAQHDADFADVGDRLRALGR